MSEFYRIIKHKSDEFELDCNGEIKRLRARGRLKKNGELLVGDFVKTEVFEGIEVITEVQKRRNSLIRPSVANVDLIVLVVAPKPEIDWFLADKMIINCHRAGIGCVICLNKSDLPDLGLKEQLRKQYAADVDAVVSVSAANGDLKELLPEIKGKLVCFAGQSAVGKSTISNGILGGNYRETGALSDKIGRGKNTTTTAAILKSDDGFLFIDTPGFSMLDVFEDDYTELPLYYSEYVELSDGCRFHPCTHTAEPDCAVKSAVSEGKLNEERYNRYIKIFNESKNAFQNVRRK